MYNPRHRNLRHAILAIASSPRNPRHRNPRYRNPPYRSLCHHIVAFMLVAIPAPSTHLQWLQKRLGTSPTLPPLTTVYRVQIPTLYATTPFGPVFTALHIPAFQAISPCKYAVLHQSFDEYGYTKARQRLDSTRSSHPRVVSVPWGPDSSHIGDHHSEAFYNATP